LDCTVHGDADAQCVFSDHCMCSEGFQCEVDRMPGDDFAECAAGALCLPEGDLRIGSSPHSCGAPNQNLVPVNCTALGDARANCVFSNHCMCSEGFVCEGEAAGGECAAGLRCEPAP
jgi:hypothetical protein